MTVRRQGIAGCEHPVRGGLEPEQFHPGRIDREVDDGHLALDELGHVSGRSNR